MLASQPRDQAVKRGLVGASAEEEVPDALAALDLLEDVDEGAPGGPGDSPPALALGLVRRLRKPLLVVRRPALVAQRVVGGDRVRLDPREPERHPARDAGAVAPARTVDRRRRLGLPERRECLR